jgi:hypothetical protein
MKLLNKHTVKVKIEYINNSKEELQAEVFTVLNEDVIDYLERRWVCNKVFNSLSISCYLDEESSTWKHYKGLNDLTKQPLWRYFTIDFFYDLVRYFNGKSDIRFTTTKGGRSYGVTYEELKLSEPTFYNIDELPNQKQLFD